MGAGLQDMTFLQPLLGLSSGKLTGGMTNFSPPSPWTSGNMTNASESQTTSSLLAYCSKVNGNTSTPIVFPSSDISVTVGSGGGLNLGSLMMAMTCWRVRAWENPWLSTSMFPPAARTLASSSFILLRMSSLR